MLEFYDTAVEDYLHIILTDEEDVPEAMGRLRVIYLLMKPIEKLTDEGADQLAIMFEIAPRLADAYRLKNEFLTVIRSNSSAEGKQKLADWLLAVEVMDLPELQGL